MGVRAVFFDIDGTLLTDNRTVSQSTIEAINSLKKAGILVGLATGRNPRFLLQYMASLGLDIAIAYNGQYIFSREELLYSQALSEGAVKDVIAYAQHHKKDISFGTATDVVGSNIMSVGSSSIGYRISRLLPDSLAGMVNFLFNRVIRLLRPKKQIDFYNMAQQSIYQIMLLMTEVESRRMQMQYPHLTFTRSSPYAVDIISKGMSKLRAIDIVGERFGFSREEVMAFGDSQNDLEMLKGVRYSVAMGNATKPVKKAASHVTDTNNRNGIYQAVQHFRKTGDCVDVVSLKQ